jgi:glycosyltransferase involved in cell wall biosynthesis
MSSPLESPDAQPIVERNIRVLLELDSSDVRKGAIRDALDLGRAHVGFTCIFCGQVDPNLTAIASGLGVSTVSGESRPFSRRGLPAYALSVLAWIVRLMRLRPNVVHLNYAGWGPSLGYAAHLCGIPVVARAAEFHPRNPGNKWTRVYIANSEAHGRSLLQSSLRDRVVVAGPLIRESPVDTAVVDLPLPPKRPQGCRILYLGQIVERKGLLVLIDALPLVSSEADLLLVGGDWQTDPFADIVRQRVSQLGLGQRVHCSNHRADIQNLLQDSDIVVVPSLMDALPRVVFEAMSHGLPVVGTSVGGIPTLIEDNVTGFLVPPNDPDALAAAISALVRSRELRERFGLAGRARSQIQSLHAATLQRYADVYRSLLPPRN